MQSQLFLGWRLVKSNSCKLIFQQKMKIIVHCWSAFCSSFIKIQNCSVFSDVHLFCSICSCREFDPWGKFLRRYRRRDGSQRGTTVWLPAEEVPGDLLMLSKMYFRVTSAYLHTVFWHFLPYQHTWLWLRSFTRLKSVSCGVSRSRIL